MVLLQSGDLALPTLPARDSNLQNYPALFPASPPTEQVLAILGSPPEGEYVTPCPVVPPRKFA